MDDDFFLSLEHAGGAVSHLAASMVAAQAGPRFLAHGSRAAYMKWGLDVQEAALREGARPSDPGFGEEPSDAWGRLGTDDDAKPVKTEAGRYVEFYARMERAIRAAGSAPADDPAPSAPVPLEAGIAALRVIEAVRASSEQRLVIPL